MTTRFSGGIINLQVTPRQYVKPFSRHRKNGRKGSVIDQQCIAGMQDRFDTLSQKLPDNNIEFWFARDLQEPLGYARWENFITAIKKAIESCKTIGYDPNHPFRGVTKRVTLGSGAKREIEDFMLTRYACYLIAQNGDPRKEPIAFAQSYFALQTLNFSL